MPLEIIGAGLGRTGTMSMKAALETLGWRCHHMVEMFQHQERTPHLEDALAGRPVDWEALFEGYTAMVDYPGALFWEPLMHAYPTAKVLLTTRDADAWYDSVYATIYPSSGIVRDTPIHRFARKAVWEGQFQGRFEDRAFATQVFLDWNQRVRDTVPADRLIEVVVGAGWGPLCAGLGIDEPAVSYPRTNSREEFNARTTPPQ